MQGQTVTYYLGAVYVSWRGRNRAGYPRIYVGVRQSGNACEGFTVRTYHKHGTGCGHCAYDDMPAAPGEILATWGGTVDIVARAPYAGQLPGAVWAAPYAVNCRYHGCIGTFPRTEVADKHAHAHAAADDSRMQRAYRLGSLHAYLERAPWDMQSADSARLMSELGERGWTTGANSVYRSDLCDAYLDGFDAAAKALA